MKAVIIKERGIAALADTREQVLPPDYIKVKTFAVAVNPTDLHHTGATGRIGGILGVDLSGIVEEVGEECKSDVKRGDKVYGVAHGANLNSEEDGAFAEYALVRDGLIAKIPANLSFEETATLGVGITSIGQALYMTMGIPLPGEGPVEGSPFFLVYGGSSATGTLAIQFAKLSGFTVVTTASPENFDLAKSRGADIVFDYHDPDCAQKIKDYTKGALHYLLDCVSNESSYKLIAASLPEKLETPPQMVTLLPAETWQRKDVTPTVLLCYTAIGKAFTKFGSDFPAVPSHHEYAVKFWALSRELLASGRVKPHPLVMREGGLAGIPDGIAEHARGEVRAVKLVYKVADTADSAVGDGTATNQSKLDSSVKVW